MSADGILSQLEAGDVLWVKLSGYPAWPARIAKEEEASPDVLNATKRGKSALVYFFGSNDFAWVSEGQCCDWADGYATKVKKSKSKLFMQALQECNEWINGPKIFFLWRPPTPPPIKVVIKRSGSVPKKARVITQKLKAPPKKKRQTKKRKIEESDEDDESTDDSESDSESEDDLLRARRKQLISRLEYLSKEEREELRTMLRRKDMKLVVMRRLGLAHPQNPPVVWQEEEEMLKKLDLHALSEEEDEDNDYSSDEEAEAEVSEDASHSEEDSDDSDEGMQIDEADSE